MRNSKCASCLLQPADMNHKEYNRKVSGSTSSSTSRLHAQTICHNVQASAEEHLKIVKLLPGDGDGS